MVRFEIRPPKNPRGPRGVSPSSSLAVEAAAVGRVIPFPPSLIGEIARAPPAAPPPPPPPPPAAAASAGAGAFGADEDEGPAVARRDEARDPDRPAGDRAGAPLQAVPVDLGLGGGHGPAEAPPSAAHLAGGSPLVGLLGLVRLL